MKAVESQSCGDAKSRQQDPVDGCKGVSTNFAVVKFEDDHGLFSDFDQAEPDNSFRTAYQKVHLTPPTRLAGSGKAN